MRKKSKQPKDARKLAPADLAAVTAGLLPSPTAPAPTGPEVVEVKLIIVGGVPVPVPILAPPPRDID